jgi:hypothetical protein
VFLANTDAVVGQRLSDAAEFEPLGSAALAWTPESLLMIGGELCAASCFRLAALPVSSFPGGFREWIPGSGTPDLNKLIRLPDGSFASPQGDYGVELFR